jgi:NifU-like protein involved in Fe-S cluster formation
LIYWVISISANEAEPLGDLPPNKLHCSDLGAGALTLAIKNYQEKAVATPKAGAA